MITCCVFIYGDRTTYRIFNGVVSCNISRRSCTDESAISYGIVSNGAEVEFYDLYNFGYDLEEIKGKKAEIYALGSPFIKNPSDKNLLATFYISKAERISQKKIKLILSDNLVAFQTKKVAYPYGTAIAFSGRDLGHIIVSSDIGFVYGDISDKIKKISVPVIDYRDSTSWELATKVCEASASNIYVKKDGSLKIDDNENGSSVIKIMPSNIVEILDKRKSVSAENIKITLTDRKVTNSGDIVSPIRFLLYEVDRSAGYARYVGNEKASNPKVFFNDQDSTSFYSEPIPIVKENFDSGRHTMDVSISANVIYGITLKNDGTYNFPKGQSVKVTNSDSYVGAVSLENKYLTLGGDLYEKSYPPSQSENGRLIQDGYISVTGKYYEDSYEDVLFVENETVEQQEISKNDLVQKLSTYSENGISKSLSDELYNRIYNMFYNGVECLTIRCTLSDYYDINGTKIIGYEDSVPVSFDIGDVVSPYVVRGTLFDSYSKYLDGTPKKYRVVSANIVFNGNIYQDLVLREIPQNKTINSIEL